jgi:replicative DNA helicase
MALAQQSARPESGDSQLLALKVPPHSVEAEQSLLGGLLLDNQAFDRIADLVSGADFYRDDHRRIWRHIARLVEAGKPADVVTVSESIEASEDKDKTGGAAYLGALAQNTPSALNIRRYAELVRERAVQRRLAQVATEIAETGSRRGSGLEEIKPVLARVLERIDYLYHRDNPSDVTGVPTGFNDLDSKTAGLQPGDLIIVAGRPSMGKTAFALNIAEHVALHSLLPVAIFSMEMSGTQLATRLLGSIARVDQHKMRTGRLSDTEWHDLSEAMGRLHDAPIFIDETAALNALELRTRARRLWRQFGGKLGLVVVDYLQLMSSSNPKAGENRATELSEISRSMKALAKELHVPVIALSQLSRAVESRNDKRPMMSDLRESGAIEQDADVILFIYRDEVYFPEKPEAKGRAEVIIGKQRNGPIGKVELTFLGQHTRFANFADPGTF